MTTTDERINEIERAVNDVVRDLFPEFCRRPAAFRYFHHRGSEDMYFWTTEPVTHKGRRRFTSGVYRYIKTKRQWKLAQEQHHARRKDAKARALELYENAKQEATNETLRH